MPESIEYSVFFSRKVNRVDLPYHVGTKSTFYSLALTIPCGWIGVKGGYNCLIDIQNKTGAKPKQTHQNHKSERIIRIAVYIAFVASAHCPLTRSPSSPKSGSGRSVWFSWWHPTAASTLQRKWPHLLWWRICIFGQKWEVVCAKSCEYN